MLFASACPPPLCLYTRFRRALPFSLSALLFILCLQHFHPCFLLPLDLIVCPLQLLQCGFPAPDPPVQRNLFSYLLPLLNQLLHFPVNDRDCVMCPTVRAIEELFRDVVTLFILRYDPAVCRPVHVNNFPAGVAIHFRSRTVYLFIEILFHLHTSLSLAADLNIIRSISDTGRFLSCLFAFFTHFRSYHSPR